jgi:hypothetical protein
MPDKPPGKPTGKKKLAEKGINGSQITKAMLRLVKLS